MIALARTEAVDLPWLQSPLPRPSEAQGRGHRTSRRFISTRLPEDNKQKKKKKRAEPSWAEHKRRAKHESAFTVACLNVTLRPTKFAPKQ